MNQMNNLPLTQLVLELQSFLLFLVQLLKNVFPTKADILLQLLRARLKFRARYLNRSSLHEAPLGKFAQDGIATRPAVRMLT